MVSVRLFWGRGGGLTKKPLIHVSTMVRLAGNMENHGMRGRGDKYSGAGECSKGTAETIA